MVRRSATGGLHSLYTAEGPKRRYVTGKTREEARQKLAKAMADRDGGLGFDADGQTLGEYLEWWLETSVMGSVRANTHASYERQVGRYVIPTLGRVKLGKLTYNTFTVKCRIAGSLPTLSNTPMLYYIVL